MSHKRTARLAVVVFMFLIAPSIINAGLFHKVLRGNISVRNPLLVDVNGDGKADLIGLGPEVWLSNGDGTFQPGQTFGSGGAGPASNAVADINGDGQPDIIVFSACEAPGSCANSVIGVLLGNGDGTFQTAVTYNAGPGGGGRVAVADANGDGKADIVLVSGSHAGTLLGNGDGTFQPLQISDLGMGPLFMTTADVNKDGRADLLLMDTNAWVSLANVDGTFQAAQATHAGALDPAGIAGADVNGDGNPDILFLDSCRNVYACYATGGTVAVQLGNGDGTFQASVRYRTDGFFPSAMAVTDVNADGVPDVLVAQCTRILRDCLGPHDIERGAGRVRVMEGDGIGGFHPVARFSSGGIGESGEIAAGDFTGDGRPDVVVTWGAFGLLIHTGRYPTSETLSSSLNPSVAGEPVTFTATVTSRLGTPTGFVRFMNGVHCLGKVTLIDGVATLTTDKLPVGTLPIIALYEPDVFWKKSATTLTQVVNPTSERN
jgi:hypothetical protein